ncbi:MAG: complex I subunit 5 family protein [Campylobacterota bacterium]
MDWFLFGLDFKVDFIAKQFLIFTSFIWTVCAVYAFRTIKENRKSYFFWFTLTFIGNFFLCFSFDVISFYILFSLMSLSSFALILHNRTDEAKNAAFVYIKYAIFGEILIFVAIVGLVYKFSSFHFLNFTNTEFSFMHLLVLIGFGIKVGMFLLNSWLPLAHSNSPASASAVLSGVMLKAGVLGWLRFFNNSLDYTQPLPYVLMLLGMLGILIGFYGLFQDKLKAVLAYSSISQMGFVVMIYSLALYDTKNYDAIVLAILFFIIHHAFNKSAIFLLANEIINNGLNRLNLSIFLITSFSLIGLPFTSGALAKGLFKDEVQWSIFLIFLTLGSIITAILMLRFYLLSKKYELKEEYENNSIIILPLIFMSIFLAYILDFKYSFSIWQLLPLVFAILFFTIIVKKEINIKNLPQGDILYLFSSFDFSKIRINNIENLEKNEREIKLVLKIKTLLKKIEKTLNKQKYIFTIVIFILLLFLIKLLFE